LRDDGRVIAGNLIERDAPLCARRVFQTMRRACAYHGRVAKNLDDIGPMPLLTNTSTVSKHGHLIHVQAMSDCMLTTPSGGFAEDAFDDISAFRNRPETSTILVQPKPCRANRCKRLLPRL